ncbi:MAG: hypothetical protein JWP97_1823 [Labilithrix sp.]|nr:hypothetical protein [Labilithrix sp.]
MHRLIRGSFLLVLTGSALAIASACGGSKKPAISTGPEDAGEDAAMDDTFAGSPAGDGGTKKDECVGFDIANVEDLLLKSACEEPSVKPDSLTPIDLKGKLEVTASAMPSRPSPGGKVDLLVTFANKSADPMVLHFRIDPVARFEVEAWEQPKKGGPKRADIPAGNPPPPPKGVSAPAASEAKSAKITLAPNGTARARVPWEAVKTRWAPEKLRGTPPEKGFPRVSFGALPKGKYIVKVVTPLVGVSEGIDHEMSVPRVEVEIN